MGETAYTSVQVPSRGALYGERMPEGYAQVRQMTVKEQEELDAGGSRVVDRVNKITNACTALPNDIKPSELLVTDRLALLFAIRAVTFGDEYQYRFRCRSCAATSHEKINLVEELDERTPEAVEKEMRELGFEDFDFEEPLEFHLPGCGRTIKLNFLRAADEDLVRRQMKKTKGNASASKSEFPYKLAKQIVEVDGEEWEHNRKYDFIRALAAGDSTRLNNFLDKAETGLDLRVYPECPQCGEDNEMLLPLTEEFFRPSSLLR